MTPSEIVRVAIEKGLDIIAITDHNSVENVEATKRAAYGTGLVVLAGMEITSSEEVHILALFGHVEDAMKMQDIVYRNLTPGENDERLFGHQLVVNEKDEIVGFNKRLLITATQLTAHSIVDAIHYFGGLSIAGHIDKEVFSIVSQLGFIPEGLPFDALEMSPMINRERAELIFKEYIQFPWVSSSDAHYIADIGKRTTGFIVREPTFYEIASAFNGREGREVIWC